ncbi:MAG: SDR family oxidoreductase, partial [Bacteroidia bacterium]
MKSTFLNKVAIITGSSGGIGKATATGLAKQGASIVINGRNQEKLELVKKELEQMGFDVLAVAADITSYEECERLMQETVTHFGKIDILVNNASLTMDDSFENLHPDIFTKVFLSNTLGTIMPTKAALPYMKLSKGNVMFISSLAGLHGLPDGSAYCAGKMSLTAFWQSMRIELNNTGIHFGICYVSFTQNDASKRMLSSDGKLVPIQKRPEILKQSQEQVASAIIKSIKERRARVVLSVFGKITEWVFRYFPRL